MKCRGDGSWFSSWRSRALGFVGVGKQPGRELDRSGSSLGLVPHDAERKSLPKVGGRHRAAQLGARQTVAGKFGGFELRKFFADFAHGKCGESVELVGEFLNGEPILTGRREDAAVTNHERQRH